MGSLWASSELRSKMLSTYRALNLTVPSSIRSLIISSSNAVIRMLASVRPKGEPIL